MTSERILGSCLCEAVRFGVRLPTIFCGHCHCTMCQRNHGAGYVTWFGISREQLTIEQGHEELREYKSSDHGKRTFCSRCGTSLFCESTTRPDEVDIPLANMKSPIDRAPQLHVFFGDRADWIEIADDLPRLGGESGTKPLADNDR